MQVIFLWGGFTLATVLHNPQHYRSHRSLQNIKMRKSFFKNFPLLKEINQHLNINRLTLDCILECCVVKKHSNKTMITVSDCMVMDVLPLLSLGTFWTGSMALPFQRHVIKFTRNEHIVQSSIIVPDKFALINVLFKRFQPEFPRLSQGCGIWAKSWWLHRKSTYLGICTWDVFENWQKTPSTQWWGIHFQRCLFSYEHLQEWKNLLRIVYTDTSVWHDSAHHKH